MIWKVNIEISHFGHSLSSLGHFRTKLTIIFLQSLEDEHDPDDNTEEEEAPVLGTELPDVNDEPAQDGQIPTRQQILELYFWFYVD